LPSATPRANWREGRKKRASGPSIMPTERQSWQSRRAGERKLGVAVALGKVQVLSVFKVKKETWKGKVLEDRHGGIWLASN